MHKKEVRRGRKRLSLLAPFWALVTALSIPGCGGGGHEVQLNTDLIRRTDKFFDVAHATGGVFVAVGYQGRVLRSEDYGQTWQEIAPWPAEWSLTQVNFVGDHGWAVGHRGTIIHSRDGGKTWTPQQSNTEKTLFALSFVDNLHGWACGDESTWLSTSNGGETWEAHRIEVSQVGLSEETSLAVPDIIYYSVKFVNQNEGWLVGEYGNIRHTADGGRTWDSQHESLLDELVTKGGNKDVMTLGAFFRVHFSDTNNGIAVGAGGAVAVTDDGGKKWRWVSREGSKADIPGLHMYTVAAPSTDGTLVMIGTNGTILTSENGGIDWKPAQAPGGVFTWLNGLAFAEGGKGVLVGGKGVILLTDDAGKSWKTLTGEKG
jgi:photosystem II stability/assembly factor-like uncharacterized protein